LNRCYAIATIHVFARIPSLVRKILATTRPFCKIVLEVKKLIISMHAGSAMLHLDGLFDSLGHCNATTGYKLSTAMQCASQFATDLLLAMQNEWGSHEPPLERVVMSLCGTCTGCNTERMSELSGVLLPLAIEGCSTLEEAFMKGGTLKVACDICNEHLAKHRVSMQPAVLPEVLVLSLNTFKNKRATLTKTITYIDLPETISLPLPGGSVGRKVYRKSCVLVHKGKELTSGHFFVLHHSSDDNWTKLDGPTVEPCDDELRKIAAGRPSTSPAFADTIQHHTS
jgi:hypothetical protein